MDPIPLCETRQKVSKYQELWNRNEKTIHELTAEAALQARLKERQAIIDHIHKLFPKPTKAIQQLLETLGADHE